MKVSLGFVQKKNSKIFRSNSNLLNVLNISTLFSLARFEAYMPVCFFSTIVGLYIADNLHSFMSLMIIGLANTFAMSATCAFNDAEDAPEDKLAPATRNIIALGKTTKSTGYLAAVAFCIISLSLSIIAGITVFLIILVFMITGLLYSWRPFRMKAMPFWDLFSHAIMGGLMFLSSAWSSGIIWESHVMQICLIFSLGIVLALLAHQLYDYEDDLTSKTRTTVVLLGKKKTYWIKGFLYFLIVCLLTKECLSGFFPFMLILSFCLVAGGMILISIALYPKNAFYVSKRMIPWAVNTGAVAAILMWYISR